MKINVVTSFSPAGYETYGRQFLKSFNENWPQAWPDWVRLYAYHESSIPNSDPEVLAATWVNLDRDQDRKKFMETHFDADRAGITQAEYIKYYTTQCTVKFSHKVWAVTSAPRDCDWLIWMDADIETKKPITFDFLKELLPQDGPLGVFLGRRWWSHSETGFWAIRMNGYGNHFLDELRAVYTTDTIMSCTNTTDCAAFDRCVQIFEGRGQKFKDLGAGHKGPDIDVMAKSILAPYLHHFKGEFRKLKKYGKVA